ncbi:MAG: EAL domain-containing protein, partial [Gammaproteobacteria bacterium]
HHQEDRAGAGQDGADQAQIHPAPREKEGGLTVKLFKGHYTRDIMEELAGLGFRFAIDDFGAGFSSLHYLRKLPVVWVKLDRSVVKGLAVNESDRDFCRAFVAMVHAYGKRVIGVGVEDAATLVLLKEMGGDFMQGFYISEEGGNRPPRKTTTRRLLRGGANGNEDQPME